MAAPPLPFIPEFLPPREVFLARLASAPRSASGAAALEAARWCLLRASTDGLTRHAATGQPLGPVEAAVRLHRPHDVACDYGSGLVVVACEGEDAMNPHHGAVWLLRLGADGRLSLQPGAESKADLAPSLRTVFSSRAPAHALPFSSCSSFVAVSRDRVAVVEQGAYLLSASGELTASLEPAAEALCAAFCGDRLGVVNVDGPVQMFDVATGASLGQLGRAAHSGAYALCYDTKRRVLYAILRCEVELLDPVSGARQGTICVEAMKDHLEASDHRLVLSPDSRFLVLLVKPFDTLLVFDLEDPQRGLAAVVNLPEHTFSIAVAPLPSTAPQS